ncbi:MAG: 6-phosphofructokinase, partial [Deltaproteobacteria bacterium]|nr:6-phosphofructokinase [Deltaproteobacteria bacterium]
MSNELYDFTIRSLGPCKIPSPHIPGYFTDDGKRILFDIDLQVFEEMRERAEEPLSVEVAGPREKIYFDPAKTKAAIVTCGGLCPGLNDVIRAVVMQLFYRYHVRNILGIRYGLQGFIA